MLTRGKAVEVLAYTAGLLDGEGCIGINRTCPNEMLTPKYVAVTNIGNTDYNMILWLQEQYGGYVYPKTKNHQGCKDVWGWQVNNRQAYDLLTAVMPYLRSKRRQAELLITYWEERQDLRGASKDDIEVECIWRDAIKRKIQSLNQGQPQRLTGVGS